MAYTLRFQDEFTETSNTALSSHTPTTMGVSWSSKIGTGVGTPTVIASDDTACHPYAVGTGKRVGSQANISGTWTNDQQAEATGWNGTSIQAGVGTRIQDDGSGEPDGYIGFHNVGTSLWTLGRVDSSAVTDLGTFTDASPSDSNVVILQSEGNTHKLYEDGTERISVTDSTYPTGGKPGLFTQKSLSSGGLDDFKARDQGGERRWIFGA
jgi:hypothetical protein